VGLVDTIKTRILRFALELKDDLRLVIDDPNELPKEKIDQQVVLYIFGDSNVIASRDFTQIDKLEINQGDWAALVQALKKLGVQDPAISDLKSALDQDAKDQDKAPAGFGKRTADWLKEFGRKSGSFALDVGVEIAKKEAVAWILGYLGHHGGPPPPH